MHHTTPAPYRPTLRSPARLNDASGTVTPAPGHEGLRLDTPLRLARLDRVLNGRIMQARNANPILEPAGPGV